MLSWGCGQQQIIWIKAHELPSLIFTFFHPGKTLKVLESRCFLPIFLPSCGSARSSPSGGSRWPTWSTGCRWWSTPVQAWFCPGWTSGTNKDRSGEQTDRQFLLVLVVLGWIDLLEECTRNDLLLRESTDCLFVVPFVDLFVVPFVSQSVLSVIFSTFLLRVSNVPLVLMSLDGSKDSNWSVVFISRL